MMLKFARFLKIVTKLQEVQNSWIFDISIQLLENIQNRALAYLESEKKNFPVTCPCSLMPSFFPPKALRIK